MSFSEEEYLQIIDNWIQCEDKIVTYIHLALELGVSCNQAKSMLYSYLHKARSVPSHPVLPFYLISGYMTEDELLVKLVNEKVLEAAKSKFSKILSIHIYSICKYIVTNPKSIHNSLTLITQDRTGTNKLSLIKNSHIKRRILKYKSSANSLPVKAKPEQKDILEAKPQIESALNEVKVATTVPKPVTHPLKKPTNAKPKKTPNTLQFSTKPITSKQVRSLDKSLEKIELNSQLLSDDSSSESVESEVEMKTRGYFPQSLPAEVVQSHIERPKKTGFLEDDSDEDLMLPLDDEMEGSQTEKQDLCPPPPPPAPTGPIINPVTGKKRKRIQRLVSEHSEDPNGFLVTKKKYVLVSTDESDSEETTKKKTISTIQTNTKQSSLNCFFKK